MNIKNNQDLQHHMLTTAEMILMMVIMLPRNNLLKNQGSQIFQTIKRMIEVTI